MDNIKSGFALLMTLVVLIGGAYLINFLLGKVAANQAEWDRYVYLLTGVEAVVFAAVGWLFGKEVHREQAQQADDQVKAANKRADDAQANKATAQADAAKAEEKGRGLAAGILAFEKTGPARITGLKAAGFAEADATRANNAAGMVHLVEQAKLLYPDLK